MSYAKKAKKGYYGIAEFKDKDGKRHQKSAGLFKLKRDALKAGDELQRELDTVNQNLMDITLFDYFSRWFELYKSNKAQSASAQNQYRIMKKFIAEYFADTKLREIKRSDYQEFINWYGANHAYKSVSKLNGAIRSCVGYAIDDDIITKDFTHNVNITYNRTLERKVDYLTTDELQTLKKAVTAKLNRYNTSRYMILTAIYTGMRKSEVQALTWNDIDFLHSTISISKSWDEKKKAFKSTKTDSSNRIVKVNRQLLKRLEELKANNSIMVFQNALGTIPTSNALNKCLRSIMNDCSIEKQGFHFHSLRHVHVAYLLSKGVDIYAISKRLGHSNITVTLNTYSYLIDEYKAKNDTLIIDKLAEL
ncbi:site-specific integrase [Limosilactobacillus sp. RRLNB_1_1]|uniref:Site-specific integrase n=1 Tax=Limosilactobacillus albertensis TaxID=2759752 RepID=A0A7W3Y7J6_9LACO|nr:site-specific integrase [Limosilactobacillus albertensis]MBB1068744.1 site-specific integrase [Limosilactobacillus albertensis]MCD7118311.1 site-specific integrase [Limosilactobacillus albertensis]MCD7127519.1 site-specific integrase [Limosilactobacillus albertensis]